jgi:hypothetical protein
MCSKDRYAYNVKESVTFRAPHSASIRPEESVLKGANKLRDVMLVREGFAPPRVAMPFRELGRDGGEKCSPTKG